MHGWYKATEMCWCQGKGHPSCAWRKNMKIAVEVLGGGRNKFLDLSGKKLRLVLIPTCVSFYPYSCFWKVCVLPMRKVLESS